MTCNQNPQNKVSRFESSLLQWLPASYRHIEPKVIAIVSIAEHARLPFSTGELHQLVVVPVCNTSANHSLPILNGHVAMRGLIGHGTTNDGLRSGQIVHVLGTVGGEAPLTLYAVSVHVRFGITKVRCAPFAVCNVHGTRIFGFYAASMDLPWITDRDRYTND